MIGCFPLAEQGPCQDGYWFTLDATGTKAVCRPRDCSDPTHVLLMDSCVVLFDDYQCPLGQEVKATPLGYGKEIYLIIAFKMKECRFLLNAYVSALMHALY